MVEHEENLRQQLVAFAQEEEVVWRFRAVPGVGWIQAATWYAYLDTPGRFRGKAALWKDMGIGRERQKSGNGPEHLGVPARSHRLLKGTLLAAALSAVVAGNNPFADLYRRWSEQGIAPKLARRNVARAQAATLWGLWKNGSVYRPEWVGVVAAAGITRPTSG
jgi:transposase